MGLKAGWLALFIFVWVIGAFLGSTFEYQSVEASTGMDYSTGTATFTYNSANVTGNGTTWNHALMAGGLIRCDDDGIWYKTSNVTDATHLTLTAVYAQAGGVNKAYTMQASPGWVGTGGGGYTQSPTTTLSYLFKVSNAIQRIELLGAVPFVVPNGEYFSTIFRVLTWQWSFFFNPDGTMAYGLFYFVVCVPFIVMGILCMILLVYGVLTGNLSL